MTTHVTSHAVLGDATIQELRASVRGPVLTPADEGYEPARHLWNGMIDKHPAIIVRCTGVADVIQAVQFARGHHLDVAIRGGGHSFPGLSSCDGGLVIDLSLMKGVWVDQERKTVRAQGGVTWGEFDRETAQFGLATTGGLVSSTGIAGLTLGGGIGWLQRAYGLSCDNLISAEIVTADGRCLIASASEHPDLFWALRGGGGNFGVVTTFEYQLHPVSAILGGLVLYPLAQAKAVLQFYRGFAASAPDELTMLAAILDAPPAPFVPVHLHGQPALAIIVCYCGSIDQGEEILRPLRTFGAPPVDIISPMLYTVLQTLFDHGAPAGMHSYTKSVSLNALDDEVLDAMIDAGAHFTSPLSAIHMHQMGGAMSRVNSGATAYAARSAAHTINVLGTWIDPTEAGKHVPWVRSLAAALQPHATGAVYVNFVGEAGTGDIHEAYGGNTYERLVDVKTTYDPTNFFHINQNIKPR